MKNLDIPYIDWLKDLKDRVRTVQQRIVLHANAELINFYWNLGKDIYEKQLNAEWGKGLIDSLSKDLRAEYPDMNGFSTTNLYNCVKFYKFFSSSEFSNAALENWKMRKTFYNAPLENCLGAIRSCWLAKHNLQKRLCFM